MNYLEIYLLIGLCVSLFSIKDMLNIIYKKHPILKGDGTKKEKIATYPIIALGLTFGFILYSILWPIRLLDMIIDTIKRR